jgi:hypothetical protein
VPAAHTPCLSPNLVTGCGGPPYRVSRTVATEASCCAFFRRSGICSTQASCMTTCNLSTYWCLTAATAGRIRTLPYMQEIVPAGGCQRGKTTTNHGMSPAKGECRTNCPGRRGGCHGTRHYTQAWNTLLARPVCGFSCNTWCLNKTTTLSRCSQA